MSGEQRFREAFGRNSVRVERGEDIGTAQGRKLEGYGLLAEDVRERAPEGVGRPDGSAAGDADRKTVRREVGQFRGDKVRYGSMRRSASSRLSRWRKRCDLSLFQRVIFSFSKTRWKEERLARKGSQIDINGLQYAVRRQHPNAIGFFLQRRRLADARFAQQHQRSPALQRRERHGPIGTARVGRIAQEASVRKIERSAEVGSRNGAKRRSAAGWWLEAS
ncbi:hypothetical protein MTX20_00885 (plasmid) [Bradyrhizobium sp. ISRA435]|nr:hypothetical protein MTX20_00885 [Bradyrhizobium sp. ISRA435]